MGSRAASEAVEGRVRDVAAVVVIDGRLLVRAGDQEHTFGVPLPVRELQQCCRVRRAVDLAADAGDPYGVGRRAGDRRRYGERSPREEIS
jgi:hypothetical protein